MPEVPKVPVGRWVELLIDFLKNNFEALFDVISTVADAVVTSLENALMFPQPLLFVLVAAVLATWLRTWVFGVFTLLAFLLVQSMGFWQSTMETLALILVATIAAVGIGLPVGVVASRSSSLSAAVRPVLDFMQTLPTFVYLVPAVLLFSIGRTPGLLATLVFAIPPGVRLTELGIRQVDPEVVEAAQAFGASRNQVLTRVQLPLAMPSIMQGVNQVIMLALSMVVVAGLIGAPGLGRDVVRAISTLQIDLAAESGISVVIMAIFLDRITSVFKDRAAAEA